MIPRFRYYLFTLSCFLLLGCSQNTQDVSATLQSAFSGPDNTSISPDTVEQLPYASLYVQQKDYPQALMVLLWTPDTHSNNSVALKWLSAKREMLVTQAGRIIKTVNLRDGNLQTLTSEQTDPLSQGLHLKTTPHQWQYEISWSPGYHSSYTAHSTFITHSVVNKQLPGGSQELMYVEENVDIPLLGQRYQNQYWLDPGTGHVIASEQYIFPGSDMIKISTGKAYAGDNNQ